jgi:hypothetical protein
MTNPAMWSRAKQVATYIVRDWMLLDAVERTMDKLVEEIELELDRSFDAGMRAASIGAPLIRAAALEEAAKVAMDEETAAFAALLRHYAKLLGGELPGVMNRAADMIEKFPLTALARLSPAGAWHGMATAPKDGTKVDLLYPYPRGRQIDCYWDASKPMNGAWVSREPCWGSTDSAEGCYTLLPEDQWSIQTFPNMEPTHWRLPPPPPAEEATP